MSKNIYVSSSFWALNPDEQLKVRQFVEQGDKTQLDLRTFYLERVPCGAVIDDVKSSLARLKSISPVFSCLSDEQKEAIIGDLDLAYYQLSTQYELDKIEGVSHRWRETGEQMRLCAQLLNEMRLTLIEPQMSQELIKSIAASSQCTHYLGVKLLVPALLESVDTMASRRHSATDFISFINERRLYWVWAGSSVSVILALFSDYLVDPSSASAALGWTGLVGGSLSWILYFMRGGFAWCGLIEHTFFPTQEERLLGLTWKERFWIQWEMRKYQILNDTIWGVCNLACFFVLVGSGLLGTLGNVFTASLLLMDAVLTVWRMYEEEVEYKKRDDQFKQELKKLKGQIDYARSMGQSVTKYEQAYAETKRRADRAKLEWEYKQSSTSLDLLYATCLLTAFVVICASVIFMPHVALILMVVGTLMCFTLNLIYNSSMMSLNVSKSKAIGQESDQALLDELMLFKTLLAKDMSKLSDEEKKYREGELKMSYLKIKDLSAESIYQKKMVIHQRQHLIVSTLRDVVIPPLFIISFAMLPLGIGLPLLIVSSFLAYGVYWYSQKTMPKKLESVAKFPEDEYQTLTKEALTHSAEELKLLLTSEEKPENPGIHSNYVYN